MKIVKTTRAGILAALGAGVLTVLGCQLPGTAQAAPAAPQLSIAVDDGRAAAAPSDTLTYTVSVTNLGTRSVKGLIITQTIPPGARLESTDPRSTEQAPTASWSVDVKPGKTTTMRTTVTVAKTLPQGLLRLAAVGCARTSAKAPPLVCASDSDQLPAGALADEQRQGQEQPALDDPSWWPLPGAVGLGGLVLAAVIAGALVLRRRSRGRQPSEAAPDGDPADLVSSSR